MKRLAAVLAWLVGIVAFGTLVAVARDLVLVAVAVWALVIAVLRFLSTFLGTKE